MAYSYVNLVGDGTTREFTFNFEYIQSSHVHVYVDGVETTDFVFLDAYRVQLGVAPVLDAVVQIKRITPKDSMIVDFQDGSTLVEEDMDASAMQTFFISLETLDANEAVLSQDLANNWDAINKRIANVADPVNDQDAATKASVLSLTASQVAAAQAAQSLAETAQTAAELAETNAGVSEANAAASAVAAATSEANAAASEAACAASEAAMDGKADKVSGATTGNFAGLDAAGNLTDSGNSPSDFMLATASTVPVGAVAYFAMNGAPTGWLKANGAAISRTAYADLFAAIGTTFGVGDGSTTFNLPDLRGEFIRSWADDGSVDSGRSFGSSQADEFKSHQHNFRASLAAAGGSAMWAADSGGGSYISNITSTGGSETRPRNIAMLACIKY